MACGDSLNHLTRHQIARTGPASSLFEKSYYELMKNALRDGGILCTQGVGAYLGPLRLGVLCNLDGHSHTSPLCPLDL